MSLLINIKGSISDITINNLSRYLDEDFNGTRLGLDLGINAFLASVIKFTSNEKAAKNLLNILRDGGHTGDIFNSLENFSNDVEKSKLLEAIGENITNHFLNKNSFKVSGWISEMAGIKENSSETLLNFAAPLVLGFLGMTVRERNFNSLDLKNYLYKEGEEVRESLPMSVSNLFNLPKFTKAKPIGDKHNSAVTELNKDEQMKSSNFGMILPWVMLSLVAASIYYFASIKSKEQDKNHVISALDTIHPEEFLPIDTFKLLELDSLGSKKKDDPFKEDSLKDKLTPPIVIDEEVDSGNIKQPSTTQSFKPKPIKASERTGETPNNTPIGYSEVSSEVFRNNSAEVIAGSYLNNLMNQLKNSNRKVTLSPHRGAGSIGEDRAFAVRDYLLENGIASTKVEIGYSKAGNNSSGLSFKLKD
jgi:hypothetical protein